MESIPITSIFKHFKGEGVGGMKYMSLSDLLAVVDIFFTLLSLKEIPTSNVFYQEILKLFSGDLKSLLQIVL